MNWYLEGLKKYAQFHGRARRKEYWFFLLFSTLIINGLIFVDRQLELKFGEDAGGFSLLYCFAVFLPWTAVTVRRLHDTSRSGWWVLLVFIPVLGEIALIVLLLLDSTPGANDHGPNPKEA